MKLTQKPSFRLMFSVASLIVFFTTLTCQKKPLTAMADLVNLKGEKVGMVHLMESPEGVKMHLSLFNLPPGKHAFHIHEKGDFTPPDFKAAGGHFNPYHKEHGMENPRGAHAGDLPNIEVGKDGTFKGELIAKHVTLEKGKPNSLFKEGGTSVIIHEKADDNMSDPAGKAGERIAGGIIRAE